MYFRRVHPGPAAAGRPEYHHPCSPTWRHLCGKNFQVHPLCLMISILLFFSFIVSCHTENHSNIRYLRYTDHKHVGQPLHSFIYSFMSFEEFCLHMKHVATLVHCCHVAVGKVKKTQTGLMKENHSGKWVAVNKPWTCREGSGLLKTSRSKVRSDFFNPPPPPCVTVGVLVFLYIIFFS